MAGTLTVQNLQGPSSGANANKIIVPSGQTLDASGGTLVPSAGAVVQVVDATFTTAYTIGTTSWTNVASLSITPKYATSKLVITSTQHLYVNSGTAYNWRSGLQRLLRGTTVLTGDTGADPYGEGQYSVDGVDRHMTYTTLHYVDDPSTTSSTTYTMQFTKKNTNTNDIIVNYGDFGRAGMMMITEIAQ